MDFNINEYLRFLTLAIVPFMLAITVHEFSHGMSAYLLGDDTAKRAGRLTLNPFAHVDIMGLLFLIITRLFGWAKPVPVNYGRLYKKTKYGPAIVAFAGPLSNLVLAVLSSIALKMLYTMQFEQGSTLLKVMLPVAGMLRLSININVALFIFNLLPLPPLDGGRIVENLLPYDKAVAYAKLERYGFLILLVLFISGGINYILMPFMTFFLNILL
ncbi:MAG: site-2 protease family protein [Deferribacterales bacterium]